MIDRLISAAPILLLLTLLLAPAYAQQPSGTVVISADSTEVMLLRLSATSRCQAACVVRDAPYAAERVMESVQVLADGNRITRTSSEQLYRDAAGRTRSESTWLERELVQIKDPVLGVSYRLYPADKTGLKMLIGEPSSVAATGTTGASPQLSGGPSAGAARVAEQLAPALASAMAASDAQRSSRSLGMRQIEGLTTEGTLSTTTIPAGKSGNTLPIISTIETWYSPQLKLDVYVKSSDPLSGERITRVQKIRRTEPAASLFSVPADYTVREITRR